MIAELCLAAVAGPNIVEHLLRDPRFGPNSSNIGRSGQILADVVHVWPTSGELPPKLAYLGQSKAGVCHIGPAYSATVGRHGPRLANFCLMLATFQQHSTNMGRTSRTLWTQIGPELGQRQAMLVEFRQICWPTLANMWPTSANFGRVRAESQLRGNLSTTWGPAAVGKTRF